MLGQVASSSGAGTRQSVQPSCSSAAQNFPARLLVMFVADGARCQTRQVLRSRSDALPSRWVPVPPPPGPAPSHAAQTNAYANAVNGARIQPASPARSWARIAFSASLAPSAPAVVSARRMHSARCAAFSTGFTTVSKVVTAAGVNAPDSETGRVSTRWSVTRPSKAPSAAPSWPASEGLALNFSRTDLRSSMLPRPSAAIMALAMAANASAGLLILIVMRATYHARLARAVRQNAAPLVTWDCLDPTGNGAIRGAWI